MPFIGPICSSHVVAGGAVALAGLPLARGLNHDATAGAAAAPCEGSRHQHEPARAGIGDIARHHVLGNRLRNPVPKSGPDSSAADARKIVDVRPAAATQAR